MKYRTTKTITKRWIEENLKVSEDVDQLSDEEWLEAKEESWERRKAFHVILTNN